MTTDSVLWALAGSLFLGGLGLPMPENPLLIGGGYALFKGVTPPVESLVVWYAAIMAGDAILFGVSYWFFTRPFFTRWLTRLAGAERLAAYRRVFATKGGWTLFLARFAFGVRALAYVAAGAAHYRWTKFLVIDALSVALQVVLFVGIGYFAGERVEWAQDAGGVIVLILGILALISIALTWGATFLIRRISRGSAAETSPRE